MNDPITLAGLIEEVAEAGLYMAEDLIAGHFLAYEPEVVLAIEAVIEEEGLNRARQLAIEIVLQVIEELEEIEDEEEMEERIVLLAREVAVNLTTEWSRAMARMALDLPSEPLPF